MWGKTKFFIVLGSLGLFVLICYSFLKSHDIAVLSPVGEIAARQKELIIAATALSAVVVIPVYGLLFFVVWKYRESNHNAHYAPEWDSNKWLEAVWWGVPGILIIVLSIITWNTSHSLDPFKPLLSNKPVLNIQVVAMEWKWLFIYPEQGIATVNYFKIPTDRPVKFEITADAPMNSFWIPKLGGQIYAMNGMMTELNLIAEQEGDYPGYSANISGEGFAGMRFMVNAASNAEFEQWLSEVKLSSSLLDTEEYAKLSNPSRDVPPSYYANADSQLFGQIISKFNPQGHGYGGHY